ncbi:hypothetical protein VSVS12_03192 [Vibrio scophthalmi]|nr:hypothetical protein VSVS12_03192 [Vibrio scophthalmi]
MNLKKAAKAALKKMKKPDQVILFELVFNETKDFF